MNIKDGNTLMMVFHEWVLKRMQTFDPDNNGGKNWYEVYEKDGRSVRTDDVEFDIVYHQSWDALMPVWMKFRDLEIKNPEHAEWCYSLSWYLYSSNDPKRFWERLCYAIKWFNEYINHKL